MVGPQRTERRGSVQASSSKNSPSPGRANMPRAKIWTDEEDEFLWAGKAAGWNWDKIALDLSEAYPPSDHKYQKTANACRKRHERIKDKVFKATLGPNRERWLEAVGAYKANRKRMWQPIADQLGFKHWKDVEEAVCSISFFLLDSTDKLLVIPCRAADNTAKQERRSQRYQRPRGETI
jgi:hypothetical protein